MATTFKTVSLSGSREARVISDGPTYIARIFIATPAGASIDSHAPTGTGATAREALENLSLSLCIRASQFTVWAAEIDRGRVIRNHLISC